MIVEPVAETKSGVTLDTTGVTTLRISELLVPPYFDVRVTAKAVALAGTEDSLHVTNPTTQVCGVHASCTDAEESPMAVTSDKVAPKSVPVRLIEAVPASPRPSVAGEIETKTGKFADTTTCRVYVTTVVKSSAVIAIGTELSPVTNAETTVANGRDAPVLATDTPCTRIAVKNGLSTDSTVMLHEVVPTGYVTT